MGAVTNPIVRAGGILWLSGGLALIAAGLAVLGFLVPIGWWRALALTGAILSLVMLGLYLHPFYGIGIGASALILAALLIKPWTMLSQLGL